MTFRPFPLASSKNDFFVTDFDKPLHNFSDMSYLSAQLHSYVLKSNLDELFIDFNILIKIELGMIQTNHYHAVWSEGTK